eukprot:10003951-Ditylum_brightwellii.AAC.1
MPLIASSTIMVMDCLDTYATGSGRHYIIRLKQFSLCPRMQYGHLHGNWDHSYHPKRPRLILQIILKWCYSTQPHFTPM